MAVKEWMLGLPGHNEVVTLDDVLLLVKGGALRPTDLVKKLGEPWRAANEVPELTAHFGGGAPPKRPEPRESARKTVVPPPVERKITARAESKPPPSASDPASTKPSDSKPSDSRPAKTEEETDVHRAVPSDTRAGTNPGRPSTRKLPIDLPKPPPRPRVEKPRLEPMVEKYFSPVDLLRCASFSFEPRKLLLTLGLVAPLAVIVVFLYVWSGARETALEKVAGLGALTMSVFGFAFICVALAFVTRRQIEAREWSVREVLGWTATNASTAFVFPVVVLMPSLLAAGVLWVLGFVRNMGTGMASTLRVLYFIPMIFALAAVLGVLVYQVACMYVPSAAAMEGLGLVGSVSAAWSHVRRQWGRILLHWLIVTVATGVIAIVCLLLAGWTLDLPETLFGPPDDDVRAVWEGRFLPLQKIYVGVALALGVILPASLFTTLGTLSYCSLRVAAAQQIATPPEETSFQGAAGTRVGADSTQPGADTKPPGPDATSAAKFGSMDS
ncbi:MAG TPA: hypothetical protein VF950_09320 [Planctomycetota bacterium]